MKNCHEDEWERTVDVNCKGVMNGFGAVLKVRHTRLLPVRHPPRLSFARDAGRLTLGDADGNAGVGDDRARRGTHHHDLVRRWAADLPESGASVHASGWKRFLHRKISASHVIIRLVAGWLTSS